MTESENVADETLVGAVVAENRRETLKALAGLLAESLESVEPHLRAPLAKQLRDTLAEIDGLEYGTADGVLDELARKRTARRDGGSSASAIASSS